MMSAALFTGLALADYELDFGIPGGQPATASVSYAGGAAPLVGSGIKVGDILSEGSPLNNGSDLTCDSCTLSFTTGGFAGLFNIGPAQFLSFNGGGTFTLTGKVSAAGINSPTTLLSGTFAASNVVAAEPSFSFKFASDVFSNDINNTLADFFGLPHTPPLYSGGLGFNFTAPTQPNGSFSATGSNVGSGDLTTTVPEPISILLLGTVLLGCAGIARRMVVR
jgi:hypothetical protein